MKRLQISIDEDLDDALAVEAARRKTSKAALIREFVRDRLGGKRLAADPMAALIGDIDAEAGTSTGDLRAVRSVDTSFWVALRFARDQRHPEARAIWEAGSGAVLTSDLVLGETWTFLRRKAGHRQATQFYDAAMRLPALTIGHVDEGITAEVWRWLGRHDERPYSFVDATSFAMMRHLRPREALAFDGDFSAAGFVEARST